MYLYIPENAHVIISIGNRPFRSLTDAPGLAQPAVGPKRVVPWLVVTLVAVVAFGAGHVLALRSDATSSDLRSLGAASSSALRMPADHLSPAEPEIPPAFREGLAQPPQVTPPPGQPSAPSPGRNPFGLEN